MRTIYLKEKKSGNFEITDKNKATVKFNRKSDLQEFWDRISKRRFGGKIIKAKYQMSNSYFYCFDELYNSVK